MNITPAPGSSEVGSSTDAPRRLLLIRHARTADNAAGRFLGRNDPELDEQGRRSAELRAPQFADLGGLCLSSPARRARETARLLGLPEPQIEEGFRELDFGDWEGWTPEEVAERDPHGFAAFDSGEIEGFPGGETVTAVARRTTDAVTRRAGVDLVVVTHATVIRVLVAALLGLPVGQYRTRLGRPGHLSRTELVEHAGGWRLAAYDQRVEPPILGESS